MELTKEQCAAVAEYAFGRYCVSKEFTVDGMNKALSLLNERQQMFVKLRFVDGKRFKEIGEEMGMCAGSARSCVVDCMYFLRRPLIKMIVEGKQLPAISEDTPISELYFNVRISNALLRGGIDTFGKLTHCTYDQLRCVRNLTQSCIVDIRIVLSVYGYTLSVPNKSRKVVKQLKLDVPRELIKDGRFTATFDYNSATEFCKVIDFQEVQNDK